MKKYKAGWVIDGSGGPPEENIMMTVEGSEIISLGNVAIPVQGDDDILNFADCTLLPGLIDAHVHLFMSGTYDSAVRQTDPAAIFQRGDGRGCRVRKKAGAENHGACQWKTICINKRHPFFWPC